MRDFFKPWRRKIGMVTLATACFIEILPALFIVFGIHGLDLDGKPLPFHWDRLELLADQPRYWKTSLPLLLISAWLLISKPRPATKPEASSPPEPDHA